MKEGRKELEEEQERIQNLIAKEKEQSKCEKSRQQAGGPTKIKVRWKSSTEWGEAERQVSTSGSLRTIFSKYGDVNEVVLSKASTTRKGM